MKRRFFAVFAVLLALMLATCDLLEEPKDELPLLTPDGRQMVHLSIKVGDNIGNKSVSRALDFTQAKPLVEGSTGYYEVAFLDVGDIYRYRYDMADYPDPWDVSVPLGFYKGANKAIVLAGFVDSSSGDHILLAIGIIQILVSRVKVQSRNSLSRRGHHYLILGIPQHMLTRTMIQ